MYNGLTTADKGALLDAKARGAEWVARDKNGEIAWFKSKPEKYKHNDWWINTNCGEFAELDNQKSLPFIQWSDAEPVNIDLALAQIAEMEKASVNYNRVGSVTVKVGVTTSSHLTWNERINQMTLEERAKYSAVYAQVVERARRYAYRTRRNRAWEIEPVMDRYMRKFLNSPYTEGETE